MRARLIVAEDFEPMQYILNALLQPHFDVLTVVSDGNALLDAVKEYRPDVVLLDISMPGTGGMAAARHLKETQPEEDSLRFSTLGTSLQRGSIERGGERIPFEKFTAT